MSRTNTLKSAYRRIVPTSIQTRIKGLRQRARHWPDYKSPLFVSSQEKIRQLKDVHKNETCVILGNGPSMRDFDLGILEGVRTISLNRGYLMWNATERSPDYIVATNNLIIEQFHSELELVEATKLIPWLHREHFTQDRKNMIFFEERWDDVFCLNPLKGMASLSTVTNTALQIAYHMGFTKVILLGIDHYFSTSGTPNTMTVQRTDDLNHFRPDYFSPGTRWHLPDLEKSEVGYQLAMAAYKKAGRHVINATPGTRLTTFPCVPLNTALSSDNTGEQCSC